MSEASQPIEGQVDIRETQAPDMEPIVALLKHAHSESRFAEYGFAQVRLRQFLASAFKDTDGTSIRGFLARVDGEPVGLISASLNPMLTAPYMFAATLILYVKAEYRGTEIPELLLDNISAWARSKDAKELRISVTFGEEYGADRSNAFFRKKGFHSAGENF
ncbi:MAG: GNAT family N-acetyltransferase, partial [Pseudomonadota bacterium]